MSGTFDRITTGPKKEDKAERIAALSKSLLDLGLGEDENLPLTKTDAIEYIDSFNHGPPQIKGAESGGDKIFNEDYEIWGLTMPNDVKTEIGDENKETEFPYEAEVSQVIIAEDEEGYALWAEDEVEYDTGETSDERFTEGDLRFLLEDNEYGIAVHGSPMTPETIEMFIDYGGIHGAGIDESHLQTAEENIQGNLEAVDGAEYNGRDENRFNIKITLDVEPEKIHQRLETAYVAAREAVKYRDFR